MIIDTEEENKSDWEFEEKRWDDNLILPLEWVIKHKKCKTFTFPFGHYCIECRTIIHREIINKRNMLEKLRDLL